MPLCPQVESSMPVGVAGAAPSERPAIRTSCKRVGVMVDFSKRLGKGNGHKELHPVKIYDTLDRASDKGPLRHAQEAILNDWHAAHRTARDVIVKLHTGQGK